MKVRDAIVEDLAAICDLHVASWKSAYRGLLSDDFLGGPVRVHLAEKWQSLAEETDLVLVAEKVT